MAQALKCLDCKYYRDGGSRNGYSVDSGYCTFDRPQAVHFRTRFSDTQVGSERSLRTEFAYRDVMWNDYCNQYKLKTPEIPVVILGTADNDVTTDQVGIAFDSDIPNKLRAQARYSDDGELTWTELGVISVDVDSNPSQEISQPGAGNYIFQGRVIDEGGVSDWSGSSDIFTLA